MNKDTNTDKTNIIYLCHLCDKELSRETNDKDNTNYAIGYLECSMQEKDFHVRIAEGCLPSYSEFESILNDDRK